MSVTKNIAWVTLVAAGLMGCADRYLQAVRDADNDLPAGTIRDCAVCPEMQVIPAGTFVMGAPAGQLERLPWQDEISRLRITRESPEVEITLARPYALGRFEVTRDQFAEFVAATGHETQPHCLVWAGEWDASENHRSWRDPGIPQRSDHPVVCVSKHDAEAYAGWLTELTGRRYTLPTEAQWEYAARAGGATDYPWGAQGADACTYGNIADATLGAVYPDRPHQACDDSYLYTAPVGMHAPNDWQLYDMVGNVWEWVADCWTPDHSTQAGDGSAVTRGECGQSPLRGGAYGTGHLFTRSAVRGGPDPDTMRQSWIGFRVAAELE